MHFVEEFRELGRSDWRIATKLNYSEKWYQFA